MGKAKKYEYENLIPIHQELAKKVFFNFMKISMVVLAILGIGVLIGVLTVDSNMASQARKVESFEAYGNDPSALTQVKKDWDKQEAIDLLIAAVDKHVDVV